MTDQDVAAAKHGTAEEQAEVLAHALPFLRRHAGATIVVKYGGHAMGEESAERDFARDMVLLEQSGVNPVVVHGGDVPGATSLLLALLAGPSAYGAWCAVVGAPELGRDTFAVMHSIGATNKEISDWFQRGVLHQPEGSPPVKV